MLTFTNFLKLDEARSHPELNPVISAYDELKPYADKDNYYISFTEIDKIGINPHSPHETPNGIYTYPLKQTWIEYNVDRNRDFSEYPFAKDAPFIWLVKPKNPEKLLVLSKYDRNDFDRDAKLLSDYIEKNYSTVYPYLNQATVDSIAKSSLNFRPPIKNVGLGGCIFYMAHSLAAKIEYSTTTITKKWSTLLRIVLGYDGVVDKIGTGAIHPYEPIQAVFFSKDSFEVVLKAINKRQIVTQGNPITEFLKKSFNKYGNAIGILGRHINQFVLQTVNLPTSNFNVITAGYPLLGNWLKSNEVFASNKTSNTDKTLNLAGDFNVSVIYPVNINKALIASKYNENAYSRDIEEIYKKLYPNIKMSYKELVEKVRTIIRELNLDPIGKIPKIVVDVLTFTNILNDPKIIKTKEQEQKLTELIIVLSEIDGFTNAIKTINSNYISNPLIKLLVFSSSISQNLKNTTEIKKILKDIGYEYIIDDNKTLFDSPAVAFFDFNDYIQFPINKMKFN